MATKKHTLLVLLLVVIGILGSFAERAQYISPELSSYDAAIQVRNVFGSGFAKTTDSPGLIGEVNNPVGLIWDINEQFVYTTDKNGGGLIRKLIAVDPKDIAPDRFGSKFNKTDSQKFMAVATSFAGTNQNFVNCMAMSPNGDKIYITSEANHNVRYVQTKYEFDVGYDSQVNLAGSPSLNTGNCDTTAAVGAANSCKGDVPSTLGTTSIGSYARFNTLYGLALQYQTSSSSDKNLFVADTFNNKIKRITLQNYTAGGTFVPAFTVSIFDSSVEKRGGTSVTGRMFGGGMIFDSTGSKLYVGVKDAILVYTNVDFTSLSFSYLSTNNPSASRSVFVGYSDLTVTSNYQGYTDGFGANTDKVGPRFQSITFITRDSHDNLYISDTDLNLAPQTSKQTMDSIRRITPDGNVTTLAGKTVCVHNVNSPPQVAGTTWCFKKGWLASTNANKCFPGDYIPGSVAQMHFPQGIAVTREGNNLFFADKLNNMIRQMNCATGYNLSFGQCVRPTFHPTPAPSKPPTLEPTKKPVGGCNPLSWVKTPSGNGCPTSCDGAEFQASHHGPFGTYLTDVGNQDKLIVADYASNAMRTVIVSSGVVTTILKDYQLFHPMGVFCAGDSSSCVFTDLHRVHLMKGGSWNVVKPNDGDVKVIAGSGFPGTSDYYCKYTFGGEGKRSLQASAAGGVSAGKTAAGGASAAAGGKSAGGGNGDSIPSASDLVEPDCHFDTPTGITGDGGNNAIRNVYVADAGNNAIKRVTLTSGDYNLDLIATGDVLNTPFGLTFLNDLLYVTSFNGHYIVKIDLSQYTQGNPIALTTADVYAGRSDGRFGHKDSTLLDSITMHPTGITHDENGVLYFNEWYKVPGELMSEGSASDVSGYDGKKNSQDSSAIAGSSGKSGGSAAGSSKGKSGSVGVTAGGAGGSTGGAGASAGGATGAGASSGKRLLTGSTVGAGSAGKSGASGAAGSTGGAASVGKSGGAGSAGKSGGSAGKSGESDVEKDYEDSKSEKGVTAENTDVGHKTHDANGKSVMVNDMSSNVNTYQDESDIDWGHEPQYLHNVRRIDPSTGLVDTVAGSYIPGIFEPDTDMSSPHNPARSDGNSFSHVNSKAGASKAAGGASKGPGGAGPGADSEEPMSRLGAGSSFIDQLLGWNSDYIVASVSDANGQSKHSEGEGKGKGPNGGGSVVGSHNTYFADGFYSYNLDQCPVVCPIRRNLREHQAAAVNLMTMGSNKFEDGSFNDGSVIYARFFKPTGITIYPDASTIYIGDTGNNRVRNITCSGNSFETVEPTFAPSAVPTFTSTDVPTMPAKGKGKGKDINGVPKVPGGKVNAKGFKAKKNPGPKEAAMSIGGADFGVNFSARSDLSISSIAIIATLSVAVSAAFVYFMFYRKHYFENIKL